VPLLATVVWATLWTATSSTCSTINAQQRRVRIACCILSSRAGWRCYRGRVCAASGLYIQSQRRVEPHRARGCPTSVRRGWRSSAMASAGFQFSGGQCARDICIRGAGRGAAQRHVLVRLRSSCRHGWGPQSPESQRDRVRRDLEVRPTHAILSRLSRAD
jgi:hypothetical protein